MRPSKLSPRAKRRLADAMWAVAPICFAGALVLQSPGRLSWLAFGAATLIGVSVIAVLLIRLLVPRDR